MKTPASQPKAGTPVTLLLLTGFCLLNSCAPPITPLPPGTPWREVAKSVQAEQSIPKFSYRMNGRKYDVVTFATAATGSFYGDFSDPVVFEDGRLYAVMSDAGQIEWDRRFRECVKSGGLPLANGVGPLHSLVMEQRQLNQRRGFAEDPAARIHAGHVAAGLVVIPPLLFIVGMQTLATAPMIPVVAGWERRAQPVNDALLDSGLSYTAFFAQLPKPGRQRSIKGYEIKIYQLPFGGVSYFYHVAFREGKVMWVANSSQEITGNMPDPSGPGG